LEGNLKNSAKKSKAAGQKMVAVKGEGNRQPNLKCKGAC